MTPEETNRLYLAVLNDGRTQSDADGATVIMKGKAYDLSLLLFHATPSAKRIAYIGWAEDVFDLAAWENEGSI